MRREGLRWFNEVIAPRQILENSMSFTTNCWLSGQHINKYCVTALVCVRVQLYHIVNCLFLLFSKKYKLIWRVLNSNISGCFPWLQSLYLMAPWMKNGGSALHQAHLSGHRGIFEWGSRTVHTQLSLWHLLKEYVSRFIHLRWPIWDGLMVGGTGGKQVFNCITG